MLRLFKGRSFFSLKKPRMIREYFSDPAHRVFAWAGLVIFLAHQGFKAYLAAAINAWYGRFYDLLQTHVQDAAVALGEVASGENGSADPMSGIGMLKADEFAEARERVWAQLVEFAWFVAPAVVIHPIAGLIRNWWVFRWRRTLMKAYLTRWNTQIPAIEGASQRVHEDTMRFASGIHTCVAMVVHSVLTLIVFCPILFGIDPSLMGMAIAAAIGGLGISIVLGWPLVDLEVKNQVVEAKLRRQLVLLEATPMEVHKCGTPYTSFISIFSSLTHNYGRLYLAFTLLGTWLSGFDQAAILFPYLAAAPRLFASNPSYRLTLGELVKISNAFGKVFDAMNVISDNWLAVNEWRSVLRRLREFERDATSHTTPSARLMPSDTELSDVSSMIVESSGGASGERLCVVSRQCEDAM